MYQHSFYKFLSAQPHLLSLHGTDQGDSNLKPHLMIIKTN